MYGIYSFAAALSTSVVYTRLLPNSNLTFYLKCCHACVGILVASVFGIVSSVVLYVVGRPHTVNYYTAIVFYFVTHHLLNVHFQLSGKVTRIWTSI